MTKYPPLQVFNEEDEPIGKAMLEEILEKGLLHRVVHIVVEDDEGDVLLQMRGPNVSTNPNTWDFAAAGYVDPGENYEQAARREVAEELGINNMNLQSRGVFREKSLIHGRVANRFVGRFKVVIPQDTPFKLQESEVAKVEWFTPVALRKLIEENPKELTAYFRDWLKEHYFSFSDENNEH